MALPFLLIACNRMTIEVGSLDKLKCQTHHVSISKDLTFTAAVPEFGTPETGRQSIDLGAIKCPGHYVLHLQNSSPPSSGHWMEWDYLALKAGNSFLWEIGESETPPDLNYTGKVTDEFCSMAVPAECKTEFEVVSGKIDERAFPKTLNDGTVPSIEIGFDLPPERTNTDLVLTLSTLYSSHVPNTRDFKMHILLDSSALGGSPK